MKANGKNYNNNLPLIWLDCVKVEDTEELSPGSDVNIQLN